MGVTNDPYAWNLLSWMFIEGERKRKRIEDPQQMTEKTEGQKEDT
jgi:hypothetical protein